MADEVVASKTHDTQSADPSQSISVDALLSKLAAQLPKPEADKLKKFIARLDRERVANRERQKAFRARLKGTKA